jgi:hypothetical protein
VRSRKRLVQVGRFSGLCSIPFLKDVTAHRVADVILKLHKWALIGYFRDNYLNNRGDWFNLSRPVDSRPGEEYRRGGRVVEGARLESV